MIFDPDMYAEAAFVDLVGDLTVNGVRIAEPNCVAEGLLHDVGRDVRLRTGEFTDAASNDAGDLRNALPYGDLAADGRITGTTVGIPGLCAPHSLGLPALGWRWRPGQGGRAH